MVLHSMEVVVQRMEPAYFSSSTHVGDTCMRWARLTIDYI